jgi:hypothetical protein
MTFSTSLQGTVGRPPCVASFLQLGRPPALRHWEWPEHMSQVVIARSRVGILASFAN